VQRITAAGELAKTDNWTSERGDPMMFVRYATIARHGVFLMLLGSAALITADLAQAAPLNLPANDSIDYSIYQRPIDLSSSPRVQQPATEQTGSAFLGTKLDFTDGQLQLFRFRLDKAPINSNLPHQQIDAGGIRLKWNW
jgi:hypothetical protein